MIDTLSGFCFCVHAEWSSWLMKRSAVSAWTGRQTSSCPVHTASVTSALISGKLNDRDWRHVNRSCCQHRERYDEPALASVQPLRLSLFLQERAEPKLSSVSPAGDRCQRIVGTVWFPHRGRHGWLHPELGWWCRPPTQALTHSTPSRLQETDPYQVDFTCCYTKCHFHLGCNPSVVAVVHYGNCVWGQVQYI